MSEEQKRFTLRMDADIFSWVQEQAKKNRRSVAKEIEFLLEQHLREEEQQQTDE